MRRAPAEIIALTTLLALFAGAATAAPPARDPEALRRSFELLHLDMKLRVLRTFYERAGLYVAPTWARQYQDEYQKLAAEAGNQSLTVVGIDDWLEESKKDRANEVLAAYKLAEDAVGKLLKADKWLQERHKFDAEYKAMIAKKKGVLEVARFMEAFTGRIRTLAKGPEDDALLAAFSLRWEQRAREVYKGSLSDTDTLVKAIAAHEHQRLEVETRLKFLKEVETGLEIAKGVQDPAGTMLEKAEEAARDKVTAWLQANYTDIDEAAVKDVWGKVKGGFSAAIDLRAKLKEFDDDTTLKDNPTALAAARRIAVLGAIYSYTLGQVKDFPGAEAFGPVLDFLDFYGQALNLVPEVARKAQAMVNKIDQRHKGIRAHDAFNVVGKSPADLLQLDELQRFGVQVATDANIDPQSPDARYYVLVEKEVIPRGFATLSRDQFVRLTEAIACERFLNAPAEASRGITSWVGENMFEWRTTNPLSAKVSDAYLADLKEKAGKTPLKPRDLIELAQGRSATINDRAWTHAQIQSRADSTLDGMAEELAIRESTGAYDRTRRDQWAAFRALLERHGVAFTPQQILRLFNHWHGGGAASAQRLEKYLTAVGDDRTARAQGVLRAGVPLVTTAPRLDEVPAGKNLTVTADVIVAHLARGREVKAEATWTLPPWAGRGPTSAPVTLKNGIAQLTCPLAVPKDVKLGEPIEVKITVRVPGEQGGDAVIRATATLNAGAGSDDTAAPLAPAARAEPAREYRGTGLFDVKADKSGPLRIATTRGTDSRTTVVLVTSDALATLSPAKPDEGLRFDLLRARTPAGPFAPITVRGRALDGIEVYPKDPMLKLADGRSGRLDKDRVMLFDDLFQTDREQTPHAPFYYRVDQARCIKYRDKKVAGTEAQSNVSDLGDAAVLVTDNRVNHPEPYLVSGGGSCDATVVLGLADQAYQAWGAHIEITAGPWRGHAWTERRKPGAPPGDYFHSAAYVNIPISAEGGTVQVTASGDGLTATISIPVRKHDGELAEVAKLEAELTKAAAERAKYTATNLATQKQAVARDEADVAAAVALAGGAWQKAYRISTATSELHHHRRDLRFAAEVWAPRADLDDRERLVKAKSDFLAMLAARQQRLALLKLEQAIWDEFINAEEARYQKLLGTGDLPERLRKETTESIQSFVVQRRREMADGNAKTLGMQLHDIGEAAYRAGDAAACAAAYEESARIHMTRAEKWPAVGALKSLADATATLTGNRQAAAAILTRARTLEIDLTPPDRREAQRKQTLEWGNPRWWPEDPATATRPTP